MKRRTLGLMLAVCLAVGLLAPAGAAEASGARVLLEAGKPDADGCFTVAMRIYNAAFNAFQFVLWYDGDTVRPVDASGQETQRFSAFAQPEDDGWMATIGTAIDPERGLIDFTGYVTPGQGAAVDAQPQTGVAVVGEDGLDLFTFRFQKTGTAPAVIRLAARGKTEAWQAYLPEGGAVLNAGVSAPVTLEIVFPEETGVSSVTEVAAPEPPAEPGTPAAGGSMTRAERLNGTVILQIGNSAASVEGIRQEIYPGEPGVTAYAHDGRTFVPVRFVAERLGADVGWENETRTVVIRRDGKTVRMTVGSLEYTVDAAPFSMDAPAEFSGDPSAVHQRTMVPIRFVAEALGIDVKWDAATDAVILSPADTPWDLDGALEQELLADTLLMLSPLVSGLLE